MPPRQKKSTGREKASNTPTSEELKVFLWKAADKLRGSVDAALFKDLVLALVFLKYVSDAFEHRRNDLARKLAADGVPDDRVRRLLENPESYTGAGVFWVPEVARWSWIASSARSGRVGRLLDEAAAAVMRDNASLRGVVPAEIFDHDDIDQRRLAELVDLFDDARFLGPGGTPARNALREMYEYFLGNYARAEGRRGGDFYTPPSVARLIVEILEPVGGRVYDPVCGSGGLLVQAAKYVEQRLGPDHTADIALYGQEINARTWRLARMNLAMHGIDGDLGIRWADTLDDDKHPDLNADFVMASPPFNVKDWAWDPSDSRWRYGIPPKNNANYAWLQHAVSKLSNQGTAAVLLTNGSTSSTRAEREIRRAMVEADLVAAVVALPTQLHYTTQIPTSLWLLAKDKSPQGKMGLTDRRGDVLFIDARATGVMHNRTERVLTDIDLSRIAEVYHAWRGTGSARAASLEYVDEPGFSFSTDTAAVHEQGYNLTPGRYVGVARQTGVRPSSDVREESLSLMRDLYAIFD
ncbi:N-6 DNA methylase [Streptomyces rubiginosohelvolus]|uniref:type I restriction-modification system subunit M n=1 Tax=Streptomyces rubiginosohelvolus TaxID=67362 RepID=UPI0037029D44